MLKENLNWKLILDPELEFPEAYMRGEITIENASLKEFLMDLVKNLGRREVNSASYISKRIFQLWRYLSNFNLPGKSRKNVEHHYDIHYLSSSSATTYITKLHDIVFTITQVSLHGIIDK